MSRSMMVNVVDARRVAAGAVQTALAAPIGPDDRLRSIGPFVVFAHALPLEVAPGELPIDFDVRPHHHIGLAAMSYVLEGHITHRDSLGSRCEVGPGGVSYMIAGRGAVHSERFERLRVLGGRLEMLQILMALTSGSEDVAPSFVHVAADGVRERSEAGAVVRRLAAAGSEAAVSFPGPMFLDDVRLAAGGRYVPPDGYAERAIYVVSGAIEVDGNRIAQQQTALLAPGASIATGVETARVMAFGGDPIGPRFMWWNYIHSSLERIEAAKAAWRAGDVPRPPGDTESFTPAPPDHGRPLQRLNRTS